MVTEELGGNILLEKFDLDEQEIVVAKKIIGKYAEKIRHVAEYDQIKLEMKVHQKAKNKHYEIKGHVESKVGKAVSEKQDSNPFVAIDEVMAKMLKEMEHKAGKKNE